MVDILLGIPDFPGFDDESVCCRRISNLRSSTRRTHNRVIRTSLDGSFSPLNQASHPLPCGSCDDFPLAVAEANTPSSETRSTVHPSVDTNRKASIVASIKGRARVGLQVRIFRRNLSLKVEERRVGDREAAGLLLQLLFGVGCDVVVGDKVADVEVREGEGFVTNQMIVFKIGRVGGSEKPAFKDIAICVMGRWHREASVEVEISRS